MFETHPDDECNRNCQITPISFTSINPDYVMVFYGGTRISATSCHFCSEVQGQAVDRHLQLLTGVELNSRKATLRERFLTFKFVRRLPSD